MIVVDTSALIAVLLAESDGLAIATLLDAQDHVAIGAPTLFEVKLVATKKIGPAALPLVDRLLDAVRADIIPFTADHVAAATEALRRFGGRPARLNFGDCMAYAVARVAGCPLLYKGGDFAATDIIAAR